MRPAVLPTSPVAFLSVVLAAVLVVGRSALADEGCTVLENFAEAPVGQFPPGWKVRKDAGKSVYSVQEEAGRRFLHAVAKDVGIPYYHIPFSASAPDPAVVDTFLKTITTPGVQPAFIH